jgi:nicotinamidase-related amidase
VKLATLIIDTQGDFFGHDRLVRRRAALAKCINELVAASRAGGTPVIWVKQEFAADLSDASLEARRKNIRIVIAGSPGAALLPELDFHASDTVIIKKRYSAFFGTDLDRTLARFEPEALVVAGINTHACVRATVIDAYQRDYDVILARECIDSHDEQHHDVSWRYMDGKLGRGMSNAEIGSLMSSAV